MVSRVNLRDLGFNATIATNRAMDVLESNPDILADLYSIFAVLCDEERSAMIASIAEKLPPVKVPLSVATESALDPCVRLGATDTSGLADGEFTRAWTQITGEMHSKFASTSSDSADQADCRRQMLGGYDFDVFVPYSVNLGIRLVYRQEWRMLGNQRGEVVRTIPLGPKQVEKVSTKIVRRTKVSKTAESLKSLETTSDVSQSTKDSTEIVKEAAESNNWKAEAEGGLDLGLFKMGGGGESSGQTEEKTRETANYLSESVRKTASKTRTETKVVVSTESESTFEFTSASEIQNPNDEIALTYVYSKLLRQYDVFTSLADVVNVVMVAEPVPKPSEVTEWWIRKNDWIIAKVLLDDSYRETLSGLSLDSEPSDTSVLSEAMNTVMTDTVNNFGGIARTGVSVSLKQVDPTQEAQRGYQEAVKASADQARARELQHRKRDRLKQHIRDNILHYCRAIWSQEDPQQRLLRYRRMGVVVPTQFGFTGTISAVKEDGTTETASLTGPIESLLNVLNTLGNNAPTLEGDFIPVPGSERSLADVINPAGPIGYHGNYAIYYMRPEYVSQTVFKALQILKWPYRYDGTPLCGDGGLDTDEGTLIDPELKRIREIYFGAHQDPAVLQTMRDKLANEMIRRDMIQSVPVLRLGYEVARSQDQKAGVTRGIEGPAAAAFVQDLTNFESCYPDYVFRLQQSRRFPVETNCLVVDILRGEGTGLEIFKLGHRAVDLRSAGVTSQKLILENERREALLVNGNLIDPETGKKLTIVALTEQVRGKIDLSVLGEEAGTTVPGGENS